VVTADVDAVMEKKKVVADVDAVVVINR